MHTKTIKELCNKKLGWKRKDPTLVHVLEQQIYLMARKMLMPIYNDLGSPVVSVTIGNHRIDNVLINLGATIDVMTRATMDTTSLTHLHSTPIVL